MWALGFLLGRDPLPSLLLGLLKVLPRGSALSSCLCLLPPLLPLLSHPQERGEGPDLLRLTKGKRIDRVCGLLSVPTLSPDIPGPQEKLQRASLAEQWPQTKHH